MLQRTSSSGAGAGAGAVTKTVTWVVQFLARNAVGEELSAGPYVFSTEEKAKAFIEHVVADEMRKRVAVLDDWQQQEIMEDEPELQELCERYYAHVDEHGESSLTWTLDMDLCDSGDVQDARRVFDHV
jgi:hypothetical protein